MARVTITLEDEPGGSVTMNMTFDPPVQRNEEQTPAQDTAARVLRAVRGYGEILSEDFVGEEDDDA